MEYTPEIITRLNKNEIFVFGSNTEGRHGKGGALVARKYFGAIYGQSKGLQGQSYAIITKDLSKGMRSVPLDFIHEQVREFVHFANNHKDLKFYVCKIGCSLAGYKVEQIAKIFQSFWLPENIVLPKEFYI
jgi:hypothetical protein